MSGDTADLIEVPYTSLSQDVLRGVVESFILREGTDYGEQEFSLDQKVSQVVKQLEQGKIFLVYDQKEGSCDLRTRQKL